MEEFLLLHSGPITLSHSLMGKVSIEAHNANDNAYIQSLLTAYHSAQIRIAEEEESNEGIVKKYLLTTKHTLGKA